MLFSERQKLEKEYYKYLDKNKLFRGNLMHVLTFLDNNGNLITKEEKGNIQILQIALELACIDLLKAIYPNQDFINHKPKITMRSYILKAEKIKKENKNAKETVNNG